MVHFLGIGAQKAGTTWLYHMLSQHPDLAFPAGKEVHFWDRTPNAPVQKYKKLFAGAPGKKLGDITPAYAILPPKTIARVNKHFPQARLIFSVRDPEERAWSAALMDLARQGRDYATTPDSWFMDHFNSSGSRSRSDYEACLLNWLSFFPQEQLLVISFRSVAENPLKVLTAVCGHLEVSPLIYRGMDAGRLSQKVFAGAGQPIRETVKPVLQEMYAGTRLRTLTLLSLLSCPMV